MKVSLTKLSLFLAIVALSQEISVSYNIRYDEPWNGDNSWSIHRYVVGSLMSYP